MENYYNESTANLKFLQLCEEIDYWKGKSQHWEEEYKKLLAEYHSFLNESNENVRKAVCQSLLLALSVEDNKDGSLSISKENRELLAKSFK